MNFLIRAFTATIGKQTQETIIALAGDEVVGQVLVNCDGRQVAEFKWLVVKHHAEGIGSALLKYAEGIAKDHGCESIDCTIDPENHEVVPWYKARGYILAGEWDDGTLLMAKELK